MLLSLTAGKAFSLAPPTPEQIEQYRRDGTLQQRIDAAKALGNQKMAPGLAAQARYKIAELKAKMTGKPLGILREPPPNWQGRLPNSGTVKVPVICIDFSDAPASNTIAFIQDRLFGEGSPNKFPYESMKNYYRRSSYGKLTITGDVLGWYRAGYTRESMGAPEPGIGVREKLIKEAVKYYDDRGWDFSQYDNNRDGTIDQLVVIWTGPDNGWMGFWWAYNTMFFDSSFRVDGKGFRNYIWEWESGTPGAAFNPVITMHETGHALGLPDLYDYDGTRGPDGGVGGFDMMHGNYGDHNAFSKFVLDWLTPDVYATGSQTLSLPTSNLSPRAVVLMPDADNHPGPFFEFFMVENRDKTGNDSGKAPGRGLLIWHVDATLDEANFDYAFDNSYTDHKLLRLMEADGLEEIEMNRGADAGDFYTEGKVFGADTTPNSARYDGVPTNLVVDNISAPDATMTFRFSFPQAFLYSKSAVWTDATTVEVEYNNPVNRSATAINPENYTMNNDMGKPERAAALSDGKTIRLSGFPPRKPYINYLLNLSGVRDNAETALYSDSSTVTVGIRNTVVIQRGWNQIGVSRRNISIVPQEIFGPSNSRIFQYMGSYSELLQGSASLLQFGGGYWIFSNIDRLITFDGDEFTQPNFKRALREGWNMISLPFDKPYLYGDAVYLTCNNSVKELPPIHHYTPGDGYSTILPDNTTYIIPWQAYWLYAPGSPCYLWMGR